MTDSAAGEYWLLLVSRPVAGGSYKVMDGVLLCQEARENAFDFEVRIRDDFCNAQYQDWLCEISRDLKNPPCLEAAPRWDFLKPEIVLTLFVREEPDRVVEGWLVWNKDVP
jgi:hypothetical protein